MVDELDALGHIDGLKDALARIRKFGGRCVLGFQSIAQVSTIYGQGPAKTIVENCSNSLILRCSASEGGGTAQFASSLIGKREIIRQTVSTNTEAHRVMSDTVRGYSYGEQHHLEDAVLASEIEALPDRQGFVKFASGAAWNFVNFAYFDVKQQAEPFEAVRLEAGGGQGSGTGWRDSAFPSMPATAFSGSAAPAGKDDSIKRMRSVVAQLEAMRTGKMPITAEIAAVLRDEDLSIEECVELMQSMIVDGLGQRATALATAMRQALEGNGATDYVEAIKIMAAQKSH